MPACIVIGLCIWCVRFYRYHQLIVNLSPGKMLRGKLQKVSVHVAIPGVGLHGPGGGECPAAAAHALVPH